jgi:hypothetical protein
MREKGKVRRVDSFCFISRDRNADDKAEMMTLQGYMSNEGTGALQTAA